MKITTKSYNKSPLTGVVTNIVESEYESDSKVKEEQVQPIGRNTKKVQKSK